ncbi:NAD-dependent epimerase/dehydratase family protein [Acidaminococcus timonensis]|uniref:NAD-dependent epimerase/dehydratase family protein n=1 Tax=Acidaminococcus timonensis TaxID=1871002 RepID=UPI003079D71E
MGAMEDVLQEDLAAVSQADYIPWNQLQGRSVLVTGGTGLIGSTVIKALCYANTAKKLHLRIFALVRNLEKAERMLGHENEVLHFIQGSVEKLPEINKAVDYIIHGASPTASLFFVEHPVETIQIAVQGTSNLLKLAKEKVVKSFIYLSSMEVYGAPQADTLIPETQGCTLDSMVVRSCYPIAKRLCENLCASYVQEYDVPAKVIRLAQTFGPGVLKDDKRVFAEFARDAMDGNDIVLQTVGTSKREYLYTADAVTAILTVLLEGADGESYNAGNPETYCSIVEMAQLVVKQIAEDKIQIQFPYNETETSFKFPPSHHLHLDVSKLENLGWKPTKNLKAMYLRMIAVMEGITKNDEVIFRRNNQWMIKY